MNKDQIFSEIYKLLNRIPDEKGLAKCDSLLKTGQYVAALEQLFKKTEEGYKEKIDELTKELNSFKGIDEEGKVVDLPTEVGDKE